jgi:hypothetical protein
MKTEYIACINLTFEIIWIKRFLADLKEINDNPIKIMCDNQVAISIIKNGEISTRGKHIYRQYYHTIDV